MDFSLSEEQKLVRETFARFSDEEVKPKARAIDEAREFPAELFRALGELGFFGLRYPESMGGSGLDFLSYCLAVSEIARGSLSLAAVASMQSLMGTHFLYALGGEAIHERLLRPALRGEKIGTICITEPNAGSDLSSIATTARPVAGGYRLDGQKMWITSATVADFFTVLARTGEERKLTIFLVERGSAGLTVGKTIEKMRVWASPTSELSADDCFVPLEHRLGEEGRGEEELRKILASIRVMTGALALGVARAALYWNVRTDVGDKSSDGIGEDAKEVRHLTCGTTLAEVSVPSVRLEEGDANPEAGLHELGERLKGAGLAAAGVTDAFAHGPGERILFSEYLDRSEGFLTGMGELRVLVPGVHALHSLGESFAANGRCRGGRSRRGRWRHGSRPTRAACCWSAIRR